jgi:phage-related protein (TIGR01555 family)
VGVSAKVTRYDGSYVNALNKFGTKRDSSMSYGYRPDGFIPDSQLTRYYEQNGLFRKIIDAPSEEAIKHGFTAGLQNPDDEDLLQDTLDALDWEQKAATALKWTRLYGGAIIVMLIDDGRGITEPLDYNNIRGIDELRVYERAIVNPDYTALHYGEPQYYQVSSYSGFFTIHASRCLVFRNGVLPEHAINQQYRYWGIPEYLRIHHELRECQTSHGYGVRLLERAVQAVYAMKDLSEILSTDDGEENILKRLTVIDMARNILNTIAIDSEGESYEFKNVSFSGVKDVIDSTCNMLSSVTDIPQTVLFGRSPAGENSTGQSDMENYYNLGERLQKMNLKGNTKRLVDIIFKAALYQGKVEDEPKIKIEFNPLWNLSEKDEAAIELQKAQAAQTRAATAQVYVDMGAADPSEIRKGLAKDSDFEIEQLLDDIDDEDLEKVIVPPQQGTYPDESDTPDEFITDERDYKAEYKAYHGKPEHIKERSERNKARRKMGLKPGDKREVDHIKPLSKGGSNSENNLRVVSRKTNRSKYNNADGENSENISQNPLTYGCEYGIINISQQNNADSEDTRDGVGVLVVKDGKILCGTRSDTGELSGPGGHIQEGETPTQAAIRETQEEFGITPTAIKQVSPFQFICSDFADEVECLDGEMTDPVWLTIDELGDENLFDPFAESLKIFEQEYNADGGEGSGRYPKGSGKKSGLSSTGANPNLPGFTPKALNAHYGGKSDHSKQYPKLSKAGYAKRAKELVRSETGAKTGIEGYRASDGAIIRYDTMSNDFVKGYSDGIATMFKPKRGYAYFEEQMKIDEGVTDD